MTAIAPTHQWCWNAAIITRISETNGDSPGRPAVARPKTRNSPASTGATFSTPPIPRIEAVPRRLIRKPATRNSAAVAMPWLTM